MESKALVAIAGIGVTLAVSVANLAYSLWSNKRTFFINTVTSSRLKWIDSLRDKVAEFIAVTTCLLDSGLQLDKKDDSALLLQRDTLLHQIVLLLTRRSRNQTGRWL